MIDLNKAWELLGAATVGPWAVDEDGDTLSVGAGSYLENPGCYTSTDLIYEIELMDDPDDDEDEQINDNQVRADAELIVFAVNNLGELLREVERLRVGAANG